MFASFNSSFTAQKEWKWSVILALLLCSYPAIRIIYLTTGRARSQTDNPSLVWKWPLCQHIFMVHLLGSSMKSSEFILIKTSIFLFYMMNFAFGRCRKTPSVFTPDKILFLYLNFLGGSKKVVATFDVREKKLNIYNDSFEWEGKN